MEDRLAARLAAAGTGLGRSPIPASAPDEARRARVPAADGGAEGESAEEAVTAVSPTSAGPEEEAPLPGEETERAMLAELRERGEAAAPARPAEVASEETPARLPPLDELVPKLKPEVRELLDELFRARFTAVRKVPAKALKSTT